MLERPTFDNIIYWIYLGVILQWKEWKGKICIFEVIDKFHSISNFSHRGRSEIRSSKETNVSNCKLFRIMNKFLYKLCSILCYKLIKYLRHP